MRRILALLTLTATMVTGALVAPTGSAVAQAPTETPVALNGLTYVAYRQYAADPQAPIGNAADTAYLVTARVYQFDSEDHANGGWDTMANDDQVSSQIPGGGDASFETDEPDDLGDRAFAINVEIGLGEGQSGNMRMLFVQDGDALIQVTAIAGGEEKATIADEIAGTMAEREPGSGAVNFQVNGTSTGGAWDRFPGKDDDVLHGLIAFEDQATVPAP